VNLDLVAAETANRASAEFALFGERGARVVISLPTAALARVEAIAAQYRIKVYRIGTVTRGDFRIQYKGVPVIQGSVDLLRRTWGDALGKAVEAA
jgi:phosphoribosylformylglycinamidine (FGAM) synthase-like enzyme